jgi:hypothetical protein
VHGGRKIAPGSYTRRATIGSVPLDDLVDPAAIRAAFAAGDTLVLGSLHRYWPPLERFCRELEQALSHPVQVNAYITPAGSRGLDMHWDTHDVFVLQCFGEKAWEVHGQGFEAPLRHQHRAGTLGIDGEPLIRTTLRPGDALYIPRGFVHGAETRAHASAHLTIGILTHSWVDVLGGLLAEMEGSPELRRALPVGFAADPAALAATGREKLAVLARLLGEADVEALVRRVSRPRPPTFAPGQIAALARLGAVDDDAMLRAAGSWEVTGDGNGTVVVRTASRALRLPARVRPAIERMAGGEPFAVADLSEWLDEAGRAALAGRFVREGLLAPAR